MMSTKVATATDCCIKLLDAVHPALTAESFVCRYAYYIVFNYINMRIFAAVMHFLRHPLRIIFVQ